MGGHNKREQLRRLMGVLDTVFFLLECSIVNTVIIFNIVINFDSIFARKTGMTSIDRLVDD